MSNTIFNTIKQSAILYLLLTGLTGLLYPLTITAISQTIWPDKANGSLIKDTKTGEIVGSELLGQEFTSTDYFWGRLSATSPAYNAGASSGSNLGPTNPALVKNVEARVEALKKGQTGNQPIPIDLVTASGSGLDPDISPAAAVYQIPRVAQARGLTEAQLRELIAGASSARQLGFLGEPRVNVLKLNLALDRSTNKSTMASENSSP